MKKLNKDIIFIGILILIGIISHLEWFNPYSILNDSDWYFWYNETIRELNVAYGAWNNMFGFGVPNIQLYFNIFKIQWYVIGTLGFSYDIAAKISFLIPVAIMGFISPYILSRKIIEDRYISFLGAIFYGTTTYFLIRQTAHIPVAFIYAMAPILIYVFINSLQKNKLYYWIIFVIFSSILMGYELRIVYILYFILFIYISVFWHNKFITYYKNIIISGIILVLLNLYWILPTIFGTAGSVIEGVANRGLFGDFLFSMTQSITLFDSAWTGSTPNINFEKAIIPWQAWIIPIIIIGGLVLYNKKDHTLENKRYVLFFLIVSILGIFLTKQSAAPFEGLYLWLYQYFPGFNLFREASKFYLITAIGYLGLLLFSLQSIKQNSSRNIYYGITIIVFCVCCYNLIPLINGSIKTMFISKEVSKDYILFKDYVYNQDTYFRTLWVPTYSRYGLFTSQNPIISNVALSSSSKISGYITDPGQASEDSILSVYLASNANQLMDILSIKYVVVPLQDPVNDTDLFRFYGGSVNPDIRNYYINQLDKVDWLRRVDIGQDKLVIYKNEGFRDNLYITKESEDIDQNIEFESIKYNQIKPTQYTISVENLKENRYINFTDTYNLGWKLRVGAFNWLTSLKTPNYFLPDEFHSESKIGLNEFTIDPEYIKANFDKSMYKENLDGSIDVELTLYFRPQSYFYLGIIISLTTLILCLGYLGFYWVRRRKNQNNLPLNLSPVEREENGGQKKKRPKSKGQTKAKIKK